MSHPAIFAALLGLRRSCLYLSCAGLRLLGHACRNFLLRLSGWWDFAARLVRTTGLTLGNCGPVSVRGSGQADLDQVLAIRIRPRTLRRARSEALGKIAKSVTTYSEDNRKIFSGPQKSYRTEYVQITKVLSNKRNINPLK